MKPLEDMPTERERIAELEAALEDAIDGMQDMIAYVPQYFRAKWKHDAYIERAQKVLKK